MLNRIKEYFNNRAIDRMSESLYRQCSDIKSKIQSTNNIYELMSIRKEVSHSIIDMHIMGPRFRSQANTIKMEYQNRVMHFVNKNGHKLTDFRNIFLN